MKQSLFFIAIIFANIFMTGCNPFKEDTEDIKQLKLNDQAILDYLSANNITAEKTTEGLYYVITQANANGEEATLGAKATMHYVGSLLSGTIVDSTSEFFNEPKEFVLDGNQNGSGVLAGIEFGAARIKEGEKATFFLPYNLAYGNRSSNDIPPYSVMKYDISSYDIKTEQEQIQSFIAGDSLTYTAADSIFTSHLINSADSALATKQALTDSSVTVSYTGRYLNGKVFDANSAFTFTIKERNSSAASVIEGWNRAVNGMRAGDRKIIILYSNLAYGTAGNNDIGPYTVLWFDITVKTVN